MMKLSGKKVMRLLDSIIKEDTFTPAEKDLDWQRGWFATGVKEWVCTYCHHELDHENKTITLTSFNLSDVNVPTVARIKQVSEGIGYRYKVAKKVEVHGLHKVGKGGVLLDLGR